MLSYIKSFALYAGERALKTMAQTTLALIIAAHGVMDVSWANVLDVAGLAMLVSILTSLVAVTGGSLPTPAPAPEPATSPDEDVYLDNDEVPAS